MFALFKLTLLLECSLGIIIIAHFTNFLSIFDLFAHFLTHD